MEVTLVKKIFVAIIVTIGKSFEASKFHPNYILLSAYVLWGTLMMIPSVIYPPEAEKKGVLQSQVTMISIIVDILGSNF